MGTRSRAYRRAAESGVESKKVIRGAIYARYSSQMQKDDSIADQIKVIKKFVQSGRMKSLKWPNAKIKIIPEWILADKAQSGKSTDRANYLRILAGIASDEFDILLVDNLSRATRDLGGTMDLYKQIKAYGKELLSASEGISTEGEMAKAHFVVKGLVNDLENDTRGNCTRRGMIGKYLSGYVLGDVPYGYRTKATAMNTSKGQNKPCNFKPAIDPGPAEIIRRIFRMYADGVGTASICKALNREGVEWPTFPKGKGWSQTTVTKMLQNEKYIGTWIWSTGKFHTLPSGQRVWQPKSRNEWIYLADRKCNEDLIIIEPEVWNKIVDIKAELNHRRSKATNRQERLFTRKAQNPSTNLLSGILACAGCGGNMFIAGGKKGGYYGCFNHYRKATCENNGVIQRAKIEAKVIEEIKTVLQSDELSEELVRKYNRQKNRMLSTTKTREQELAEELQRIKVEVTNIVNCISSGGASEAPKALMQVLKTKECRIAELERLLAHANFNASRNVFITKAVVKGRLERLTEILSTDRSSGRRIVASLIEGPILIRNSKDVDKIDIKINAFALLNDHVAVV